MVWILFLWNMACQLSAISRYEWNDSLVRLKTVLFMECQSRMEADIFANCSFPRIVWYALAPHAFPKIMQLGKLYIRTYLPFSAAAELFSIPLTKRLMYIVIRAHWPALTTMKMTFCPSKASKVSYVPKPPSSLQTVFRCDLWAACINLSWKTAQEGTLCTAQPPLCEGFSSQRL